MNWLMNLFYKYKVINPTTSLYQSFDTGQSAMMMEGPWTNQAGLNWEAAPIPVFGNSELLRTMVLRSTSRRAPPATSPPLKPIKWLSDNSYGGASPRGSRCWTAATTTGGGPACLHRRDEVQPT